MLSPAPLDDRADFSSEIGTLLLAQSGVPNIGCVRRGRATDRNDLKVLDGCAAFSPTLCPSETSQGGLKELDRFSGSHRLSHDTDISGRAHVAPEVTVLPKANGVG